MFAATTNTTLVLPISVGTSSVGGHHCRLSSMGKTRRRLSGCERGIYVSDVRFCFLLWFACFLSHSLLFWCVLVHVSWLHFLFLVFVFFGLPYPSFILSVLACSSVAFQECLVFYCCSPCFYSLAIVSTFLPNNVWLFDTRLISIIHSVQFFAVLPTPS